MAELVSSWLTPSVFIVSACGEIDVTNSAPMTDYVLAIRGRGLILDLSGLIFFGTEGFSALHRVAVGCAYTGTAWSVVPGTAGSRLLRVCDPEGKLPAAATVDVALAIVQGQSLSTTARHEPKLGQENLVNANAIRL